MNERVRRVLEWIPVIGIVFYWMDPRQGRIGEEEDGEDFLTTLDIINSMYQGVMGSALFVVIVIRMLS